MWFLFIIYWRIKVIYSVSVKIVSKLYIKCFEIMVFIVYELLYEYINFKDEIFIFLKRKIFNFCLSKCF